MILQGAWIEGFGSRREIVEFIARYGPVGWVAILASAVTLAIALAPSLEIVAEYT